VFEANEKQTNEAHKLSSHGDATFRARALHRTGFMARPFDPSFNYIGDKIAGVFRKRENTSSRV
jgi:hypothetical protein